MNIIGLKKCSKCGHKDVYGCHNYYTIGAPFRCPKCKHLMDHAPYKAYSGYVSDKQYNKTFKYFKEHIETIDYEIIEKGKGIINIVWKGVK
jgi:hypothetical protein